MTISYLVSTAGHAQEQNDDFPHDVRTILQLIEDGSRELGNEKVVGFARLTEGQWDCQRLSYVELIDLSSKVAADLIGRGVASRPEGNRIIAMLCPTGPDFLLTWIALMRMGYGVVLVAPQCSPSAIVSLLKGAECSKLLHHPKYEDLAKDAAELDSILEPLAMSPLDNLRGDASEGPLDNLTFEVDPESTSHVFHTSGSSGNPKPIPNQHLRSVSSLPRRAIPTYLTTASTSQAPSESAAFTTTPLFHGGVSDLLRAWMARSVLYLYPTSDVPITPQNVIDAVNACQAAPEELEDVVLDASQRAERAHRFKVTAFLSVPYILTILAEDPDGPGMDMLSKMDFVSTGGAPLDTRLGDTMVKRGVHLVSRLGSSECGFLLSSHRDYEAEHDWEWLRNDSAYADALVFEPTEDSRKFQMIVTDRWKSKSKSNRHDNSYETGDLYQPHESKANVWKYVGRGDDVIVMSNGEKASPGPIETVFRSSPLVADALVVGSDKPQLGLLLFLKSPLDDLAQLSPLLDEANRSSPSFAQLSLDMIQIIKDGSKALPKSSKGTTQRRSSCEVFAPEIEALYTGNSEEKQKRSLEEIETELRSLILGVAGEKRRKLQLDACTDLFNWGVDSLMATRVRAAILKTFDTGDTVLPVNVVFEKPSIAKLSQHIYDLQEGHSTNSKVDIHQLMRDYVKQYSDLGHAGQNGRGEVREQAGPKTIILTGATGSLGAFILSLLSQDAAAERVLCLVRASDDAEAQSRVLDILRDRNLSHDPQRIQALAADLASEHLGLQSDVYQSLGEDVEDIIHAAWPVHFASSLVSFEDSFKGLNNLLKLVNTASEPSSKLFFCSSLASVLAQPAKPVLEELSSDPTTASPIGYSQSKWVAEGICASAQESATLQGRVKIMRIGQLCGDTATGRWNEKEGWPLMIRTAQTVGCLPLLQEKPSWLPVDLAAKAIIDLVQTKDDVPQVTHIAHPENTDWDTILDALETSGLKFERVQPKIWLEKTLKLPEEDPSRGMLPLWQSAYGSEVGAPEELVVDTSKAQAASGTMRNVPPIDRSIISKMVDAWRQSGFLHP